MPTGYCVKCKAVREIQDPHPITMKNKRAATEGRCPVCGTRIFKIGGAAKPSPEPVEAEGSPAGPAEAAEPAEGDRPA